MGNVEKATEELKRTLPLLIAEIKRLEKTRDLNFYEEKLIHDMSLKILEVEGQKYVSEILSAIHGGSIKYSLHSDVSTAAASAQEMLQVFQGFAGAQRNPNSAKSLISKYKMFENTMSQLEIKNGPAIPNNAAELVELLHGQLVKIEHTRKTFQEALEKQLNYATSKNLSDQFEIAANSLNWSQRRWLGFAIVIAVAVPCLLVFSYMEKYPDIPLDSAFGLISRIGLSLPVIALEVYVLRQHSRTLSLAMEYRFKSAVAKSLEGYRQIIADKETSPEVKQYLIATTERLFAAPKDQKPDSPTDDVIELIKAMGSLKK